MKVNPISFFNLTLQKQHNHRYGLSLKPQLGCDSVCFRGCDLLDLPKEEVIKRVQESIKPENFLGQGTEAEVYRIKDTDYCVRIPYVTGDMYASNYTKELTPIDKLNHVRARLGFGASIMDYFDGVTPKEFKNNDYYRNIFQEKISNLPIKSYTDLLHQISNAIDNEMVFDFSGGNLIVDLKKQKLTAIDFYNLSDNPRPIRPLLEMYSVLTSYGAREKTGKKIYDKVVEAGLEEFKPNKIPCMDVELFDFVELVQKRHSDNYGYKKESITARTDGFNRMLKSVSESLKTLKQIKKSEIIDKSLSPILNSKLSEFKKLMMKIH